jgi:hypothetical protein
MCIECNYLITGQKWYFAFLDIYLFLPLFSNIAISDSLCCHFSFTISIEEKCKENGNVSDNPEQQSVKKSQISGSYET